MSKITPAMGTVTRVDAGGGVLYRQKPGGIEILLICRRKMWDLPKGKREQGESFEVCAMREVEEETGAVSPEVENFLTETTHEYEENGILIEKRTRWFSMKPSDPDFIPRPQTSEEIEAVEWVGLHDARRKVAYDNLVKVLDSFEAEILE